MSEQITKVVEQKNEIKIILLVQISGQLSKFLMAIIFQTINEVINQSNKAK